MDPAALGTTLIGLDAIRAASSSRPGRATRRDPSGRSQLVTIRLAVAATLRGLADSVDAKAPGTLPAD
jgi:hypothetical protein